MIRMRPFVAGCSLVAAACSSSPPGGGAGENVGTATAAITEVPSGVGCIEVDVTGARSVTSRFDVTAGEGSVLSLTGLPLGLDTFVGLAYPSACSAVTSQVQATWISAATQASLTSQASASIALDLHPNGQSSVSINFDGDDGGAGDDGGDEAGDDAGATASCPAGLLSCAGNLCLASCPVVTWGNNATPCTQTNGWSANYLIGQSFALPAMTVSDLGVNVLAGSATVSGILALYSDADGVPGSLVAWTLPAAVNAGANVIPLPSSIQVAAGTYWIVGEFSDVVYLCRSATAASTEFASLTYPAPPPASFPVPTTYADYQIGYYVQGH
jgi:hypothetical protein